MSNRRIAGKLFKVAQDQKIFVNRLQNEEGSEVSFSRSHS